MMLPGIVHGHVIEPKARHATLRIFVLRSDGTTCVRKSVPHWTLRPAPAISSWLRRDERHLVEADGDNPCS